MRKLKGDGPTLPDIVIARVHTAQSPLVAASAVIIIDAIVGNGTAAKPRRHVKKDGAIHLEQTLVFNFQASSRMIQHIFPYHNFISKFKEFIELLLCFDILCLPPTVGTMHEKQNRKS